MNDEIIHYDDFVSIESLVSPPSLWTLKPVFHIVANDR